MSLHAHCTSPSFVSSTQRQIEYDRTVPNRGDCLFGTNCHPTDTRVSSNATVFYFEEGAGVEVRVLCMTLFRGAAFVAHQ